MEYLNADSAGVQEIQNTFPVTKNANVHRRNHGQRGQFVFGVQYTEIIHVSEKQEPRNDISARSVCLPWSRGNQAAYHM